MRELEKTQFEKEREKEKTPANFAEEKGGVSASFAETPPLIKREDRNDKTRKTRSKRFGGNDVLFAPGRQLANLLKLRRSGDLRQLEKERFGGRRNDARSDGALERDLSVERVARRDAVGDPINVFAEFEQVERGLKDANMRFDSGENNVWTRVGDERGANFGGCQTAERRFVENGRVFHCVGDFRERFAQPFRVLTRRKERNVENGEPVEEKTIAFEKTFRFGNCRNDFLLEIDNQRGRVFGGNFHRSFVYWTS